MVTDGFEDDDDDGDPYSAANKDRPTFRLLTVHELRELPPPQWLVQGLLQKQSLSVLYGPSGEGKSFVALDLAASIGAGTDWHGRKVQQGPVVYVVAEGGRGIVRRIEAWTDTNDTDTDSFFIVPEPVQMSDPKHRSALAEQIEIHGLNPSLVVFDTFARCFVGGDENSAGDVGKFIAGVQEVQRKVGGTAVLIVHHTGKTDLEMERGSSALRAAADTMLLLRKKDGHLTLTCNKQKDGDVGEPVHLQLQEVELELDNEGERVRSCVVQPRGSIDGDVATSPALTANARTALEVLSAHPQGLPIADWITLVGETLNKTVSEHTFAKVRRKLVDLKLVESVPDAKSTYRASNPAK
jgi:hypothetical protein